MFTSKKGMTLIEIIVAGSIALIVVGLLAFQQSSTRKVEKTLDERQSIADLRARLEAQLRRDLRSAVGFMAEKDNRYRITTLYLLSESETPAYQDVTYEYDGKGHITRYSRQGRLEYDFSNSNSKTIIFILNDDGTYQIDETKGRVFIHNDFGMTEPGAPIWNEIEPIELPRL